MNKVKVFKSEYGYSIGVSNKNADGSYLNDFFPAQFKKGVELDNQTDIDIKEFRITPYKTKDDVTKFKICIWEFEEVKEEKKEDEQTTIKLNDLDLEEHLPF